MKIADVALGVDIGGTSIRAGLVDRMGRVLRWSRRDLDGCEPERVLAQIERMSVWLDCLPDVPVGIGLAGKLSPATGTVSLAPNLGWRDIPFGQMLETHFGYPVRLVNDLSAITVGEVRVGAARGASDVVCVFVGTGVGMGAVSGGRLVEGARGLACELGHVKVESPATGRACGCGERGCLEAYVSGCHLSALYMDYASGIGHEVPAHEGGLSAGFIDELARRGDLVALAVWQQATDYLARAVGATVTLLDPTVLVLGGGVLMAAPRLKEMLINRLPDFTPAQQADGLEVSMSAGGDLAGVIGAGLLALEREEPELQAVAIARSATAEPASSFSYG